MCMRECVRLLTEVHLRQSMRKRPNSDRLSTAAHRNERCGFGEWGFWCHVRPFVGVSV